MNVRTRNVGLFIVAALVACFSAYTASAEEKETPRKTVVITRDTVEKPKRYKLIPLSSMSYETVDQICRRWLSKDGILTYEQKRNSILVYDSQDVIDKISKFLRDTDRQAINVRINVQFLKSGYGHDDLVRVDVDSGKDSHQKLVWKNGKFVRPSRIDIHARQRTDRSTSNNSQIIVTRSGMAATLFSGTRQVDPSWITANRDFIRPDTYIVTPSGVIKIDGTDLELSEHMVDIGSSLKVLPIYHDNGTVTLQLYPEISWVDNSTGKRYLRRDTVTTEVTVQEGKRFYLGGTIANNSHRFKNLFGPEFFGRNGEKSILDIYVTATAIKPNGRPLNRRPSRPGVEDPKNMFNR